MITSTLCVLRMRRFTQLISRARVLKLLPNFVQYVWNKFRQRLCKIVTNSPWCRVNLIFITFSVFTCGTITKKCLSLKYIPLGTSRHCPENVLSIDVTFGRVCPISFQDVPFYFRASWLSITKATYHYYLFSQVFLSFQPSVLPQYHQQCPEYIV